MIDIDEPTLTPLPAPDRARLTTAAALQTLLPELVALTLDVKQAHWNVTGPTFLPLHGLTDDLAAATGGWADRLAERAVALGFYVDARPGTVAAAAGPFPIGRLDQAELISELTGLIDGVVGTTRLVLERVEPIDPVGHGIAVEILEGLEKYRWMLTAHAS